MEREEWRASICVSGSKFGKKGSGRVKAERDRKEELETNYETEDIKKKVQTKYYHHHQQQHQDE